jgi:hypothetical protein
LLVAPNDVHPAYTLATHRTAPATAHRAKRLAQERMEERKTELTDRRVIDFLPNAPVIAATRAGSMSSTTAATRGESEGTNEVCRVRL